MRRGLKAAGVGFGVLFTAFLGSTAFFDWHIVHGRVLLQPRFSPGEFLSALSGNLGWLAVFTVLSASMLPLRAIQWQRTLEKPVPFSERWHFVNLGAAVHNILPGNMGDVTRAFLLARTQRLPFLVGLGSVAVCKLLELAALVLMASAAMFLPFWSSLPELGQVVKLAFATCGVLVLVTVLLARFSRPLALRLPETPRWLRIRASLLHVDRGLGTARSARGLSAALAYSFPPNLAAACAYGIGLRAMGLPHGLEAGPLVLALIALGKGTPGMPTGPGMYFLVTSWVARSLGAPPSHAAAYALLTNVATGVSHWIPGLVSLAIRRVRWSELKHQTTLAAEAARKSRPTGGGAEAGALAGVGPRPKDRRPDSASL